MAISSWLALVVALIFGFLVQYIYGLISEGRAGKSSGDGRPAPTGGGSARVRSEPSDRVLNIVFFIAFGAAFLGVKSFGPQATWAFVMSGYSQEELRAKTEELLLNGSGGEVLGVMRTRAPEDFEALIDRFCNAVLRADSGAEARSSVLAVAKRYTDDISQFANQSPDRSVREALRAYAALIRAVEHDPAACVPLITTSSTRFALEMIERSPREVGAFLTASMNALYDGRDRPVPQPLSPSDDDRVLLINSLLAEGMSADAIFAVQVKDISYPTLCASYARYLEGVVAMEGEAGERVRSDIFSGKFMGNP